MGQKTHPKGFRLITTQNHLSTWYSSKLQYPTLIEEDYFLRSKIHEVFGEILSISKIEIERIIQENNTNEFVSLKIHALFPRAKDIGRKIPNYLNNKEKAKQEEEETTKNLLNLSSLRGNLKGLTTLVLKKTIRNLVRFFQIKTKKNYYINIHFIKNPFEDATLIAKYIADQLEKRIPFRRAVKPKIDYTYQQAETIYGIIGIKVWLFVGE